MEISFELELIDWIAFNKHYLTHSKEFKKTIIISKIVMPIIFSLFIFYDILKGDFNFFKLIFFSIVSILFAFFLPKRIIKNSIKRMTKLINEGDNSNLLCQHKITFGSFGIILIKPESESKINWNAIKKGFETENYYFLYNSSITAFVIPKKKISENINELDEILKKNITTFEID